jgi:hypothetical protein
MIGLGRKLDQMLAEGEIPAMLSPDLPKLFLQGDKRIVRMFPSYKEIELAYFRRTGNFPIMHVTTIKREIVDKHPWVTTNLVKAQYCDALRASRFSWVPDLRSRKSARSSGTRIWCKTW